MAKNANNFYLSLLAFTFGIAVATFNNFTYPTIIWLLGISFLCALFYYRLGNTQTFKIWLTVSLILAFFVIGALRMSWLTNSFGQSDLETRVGEKVALVGLVVKEPEQTASSLQLIVKSSSTKIIVTTDRYADIRYGDQVLISGLLKKPESFTTGLGREFDYPNYLLARGVEFQISFATVVVESRGKGNVIISTLLEMKQAFLRTINSYLIEPNSGLAAGLLLGVKQGLGESLEADFRTTGIIHIVVLSGYNIMLIITFVMYILGSFLAKRTQFIVGIFTIVGFALMVGLSATVVRACLMASLLLLAEATNRRYLVLRALFLAATAMLLLNPYLLIYDIGFQLSFLATLGLILLAPILEQYLTKIPNWLGIRLFILATLSTQIMVMPILLYYMGEFSVLAVLANVLVLPMVPLAMGLTFFTGLVGFLWPALATVVALPTYFSLAYIIEIARYLASLPFASFLVSNFSVWWLLPTYLGLGLYLYHMYALGQLNSSGHISPLNIMSKEKPETETDFSDWVVVEEFDETKDETKTETSTKIVAPKQKATTDDLPIFFR